ncbi:MAG: YihY/virulence factor BrkB family protein [Ilumatobacteraceae bacterium]
MFGLNHWTELALVRRLRKHRIADIAVESAHGYQQHRSANAAALIAYYGFLTLFPALLLATTVLGFVLENNPALRADIVDTAIAQIPIIGREVLTETGGLTGSTLAIMIGILGAVWGATRAFVALQDALDNIWEVPLDERHNLVIRRLHGIVGLLTIAAGQIATVVLTSIASYANVGLVTQFFIALSAVVVNSAVIGTMFRYLTAAPATWKMVRFGAIAAGLGFTLLQLAGTNIVARLLSGAQGVYGTFASVLALTAWISLHATIALFSAEVNATRHRLQ